MSDSSVFLYAERALGRGWVGVQFHGLALPEGATQVCFLRWGHKQPYLGAQGWQVAENWCEVRPASGKTETIDGVLLSPQITVLLEEGTNYKLAIRVDGEKRFERPVRWGGIAANGVSGRTAEVVALAGELKEQLDEKNWRQVFDDKDEQAVAAFIKNHPSSAYIPAAHAMAEEIAQRKRIGTRLEADAAAWTVALASDCKAAYATYLSQHSDGAFADEARDALAHFLPSQILIKSSFATANLLPQAYDLDTCAFLLSDRGRVRADRDFVCSYAVDEDTGLSLAASACGSVIHRGKDKSSQRDLPSESIAVDLHQIPADIVAVALTISLDPYSPPQTGLESIAFAVIEVFAATTSERLLSIDFQKDQYGIKGNLIAEIVRRGPDWKIVGRELVFAEGLDEICAHFGVNVH